MNEQPNLYNILEMAGLEPKDGLVFRYIELYQDSGKKLNGIYLLQKTTIFSVEHVKFQQIESYFNALFSKTYVNTQKSG